MPGKRRNGGRGALERLKFKLWTGEFSLNNSRRAIFATQNRMTLNIRIIEHEKMEKQSWGDKTHYDFLFALSLNGRGNCWARRTIRANSLGNRWIGCTEDFELKAHFRTHQSCYRENAGHTRYWSQCWTKMTPNISTLETFDEHFKRKTNQLPLFQAVS